MPSIPLLDRFRVPFGILVAISSLLTCLLSSCQFSFDPRGPEVDEAVHASDDITLDTQQIRLRMRSLVDPMSGEIEDAADRIIAQTNDPTVRRAATEWKAEAIPALRESLFQPQPMTALFDTWVLTNQMAVYFSEGRGRQALGKQSAIALTTCLELERQMNLIAASMTKSKDVTKARALARNWAAAHPISTSIAHRETTLSRAGERDFGPMSARETVADITMTVDDLNRRLEVYSDQLVRQARWEAELLTMDLSDQLQLNRAIPLADDAVESVGQITESVDSITTSIAHTVDTLDTAIELAENLAPNVERLVAVVESAPELIAAERTATLEAVQAELNNAIEFVQQERIAALQHVTSERLAALQSLHESITQERQTLTKDVAVISTKAIDHAFWRATQLLAAVLVVLLVSALVGLGLIRRMITGLLHERNQGSS
jgi:hypothetical protein